jgi:hypothetical protein
MKKYILLLSIAIYTPLTFAEPYLYYCADFAHTTWQGIILTKDNQSQPLSVAMTDVTATPAGTFLVNATITYNTKLFQTTGRCEQNDGKRAHHFVFEVPILHLDIGEHAYLSDSNAPDGVNLLANLTGQTIIDNDVLQNFYAGQLLFTRQP